MTSVNTKADELIFEVSKNILQYISTTDLLINNNLQTINYNQFVWQSNVFSIKKYNIFKYEVQKISTNADTLNNTGVQILQSERNTSLAANFFRFASELALSLHVCFHYQGGAVFYNLFLIEQFLGLDGTKHFEKAQFLLPQLDRPVAIHENISNLFVKNPHQLILQHCPRVLTNLQGSIVILPEVFATKYQYITAVFEGYKDAVINAKASKLAKFTAHLKTTHKMLLAIVNATNLHHLHYHKCCSNILFNAALCDIALGNLDLALSSLTKAVEFDKNNEKNPQFALFIDKINKCLS